MKGHHAKTSFLLLLKYIESKQWNTMKELLNLFAQWNQQSIGLND